MFLNVGCGEHYATGWVNLDLHDHGPRPDVAGSILNLPFPDRSAERVYCGHVLEHVRLNSLPAALSEVRRVITDDGVLMVVGPDINLTREHEPILIDGVTHGGQRWVGDAHKWIPTGELTLCLVNGSGFDGHLMSVADVSDRWPIVDRAPWQFAILAKPKE